MSCQCQTPQQAPTSPTGECLPTLDQACGLAKSDQLCAPCASDEQCLSADKSDGTTLPNSWLDSCCVNGDVTLLARFGNKLVRFTQSGFLKLTNGKATVVDWIPFKVKTLWHRYWLPSAGSTPVIGDPLDFPYKLVIDEHGNPHAIQGKVGENSLTEWDFTSKAYRQRSVSEILGDVFGDGSNIPNFVTTFNTALNS